MSGSGGGGGAYASDEVSCELINENLVLASPDPAVPVAKGDILKVEVRRSGAPVAVCVTAQGQVAGSLAYGEVRQLIRCIESGHKYIATVTSVVGGRRTVEITHR
jgi:hypothetical protein